MNGPPHPATITGNTLPMKFLRIISIPMLWACLSAGSQCPKGATNCTTIKRPVNGTGPGEETITRFDNNAHTDAISREAESATRATLDYFFITRPALEAIRNEGINSIEGRYTSAYQVLDLITANDFSSLALNSLPRPTVKGHRLGESWPEFLITAPLLHENAEKCLVEQSSQHKKDKRTVYNPCGSILMIANDGSASVTFNCLDVSYGVGKDMLCQDFDGEVTFTRGSLSSLKLIIPGEWGDNIGDIQAKFGVPSAIDEKGETGVWKSASSYLIAAEVNGSTAISWMSSDQFNAISQRSRDALASQKDHAGNSLD
jgi:hypothetical protein